MKKQPYAHFKPVSVLVSVTKVALFRVIVHSSSKEEFHIPSKASARLALVVSELAPGLLKDLLTTSTVRALEHLAIKLLNAKRAGQLMTGVFVV